MRFVEVRAERSPDYFPLKTHISSCLLLLRCVYIGLSINHKSNPLIAVWMNYGSSGGSAGLFPLKCRNHRTSHSQHPVLGPRLWKLFSCEFKEVNPIGSFKWEMRLRYLKKYKIHSSGLITINTFLKSQHCPFT